jgi:minor extracellular serine protease Vpr
VVANPRGAGHGRYNLRVPFLLVPRGTSDIRPATPLSGLTVSGDTTSATIKLKNFGGHAGVADVYAWGETDAKDGQTKTDIRATGVQSVSAAEAGLDPSDRLVVFAVNMWKPWSTPSDLELDVEIDTDGDGVTDFTVVGIDAGLLFAGEPSGQTEVFTFDADGNIVDGWDGTAPINGSTYLLPVAASSLGLAEGTGSFSYDTFSSPVIAESGVADDASGTGFFDPFAPAVSQSEYLALAKGASVTLTLEAHRSAYVLNPTPGWLIVSNDDADGSAQANVVGIWDIPSR